MNPKFTDMVANIEEVLETAEAVQGKTFANAVRMAFSLRQIDRIVTHMAVCDSPVHQLISMTQVARLCAVTELHLITTLDLGAHASEVNVLAAQFIDNIRRAEDELSK